MWLPPLQAAGQPQVPVVVPVEPDVLWLPPLQTGQPQGLPLHVHVHVHEKTHDQIMNKEIHHRRSIRLKGYDYSQNGAYFITICAQDRACLFGEIVNGEMQYNDAGKMVQSLWQNIPENYDGVQIDEFIIMPNHLHGIIVLNVGAGLVPALIDNLPTPVDNFSNNGSTTRVDPTGGGRFSRTVGDVVGGFKSRATVEYIRGVKNHQWSSFRARLWQRNYYEHIIRNETTLYDIRDYIINNPKKWALDRENPAFHIS